MEKINYIKAEIYIQEGDANKDTRIINSFENVKKEKKWNNKESDFKYANEKEIMNRCQITINDKPISFCYFYKFNQKGKYNIKYSFSNKLTNIGYMFYECNLLTNIDLSNFDTQNITIMSW